MSNFWYIMKDFMDECPILAMFVLLLIAGCMVFLDRVMHCASFVDFIHCRRLCNNIWSLEIL